MIIFPTLTGMSFTVNKGPSFNTLTKQAASGRQVRVSLQSSPVWKFKLAFEFLRDRAAATSDVQNLWAFFNAVNGQFNQFYFLDPYENAVLDQGLGVGNGSTTSFQLTRTVGAGTGYPWIEPVYGVSGAPTVYVNGAVTAATLNAYGVISFATPPANGAAISWSGTFMFLCHFTQDDLQLSQMVKGLWSLDGLEFESLIP
jgi:uncharacterized protein (TIGR02217 family)